MRIFQGTSLGGPHGLQSQGIWFALGLSQLWLDLSNAQLHYRISVSGHYKRLKSPEPYDRGGANPAREIRNTRSFPRRPSSPDQIVKKLRVGSLV